MRLRCWCNVDFEWHWPTTSRERLKRTLTSFTFHFDDVSSNDFNRLSYNLSIWSKRLLDLPKFGEMLQNVTVPVGREAVLQCVVDNLQTYKVIYWTLVEQHSLQYITFISMSSYLCFHHFGNPVNLQYYPTYISVSFSPSLLLSLSLFNTSRYQLFLPIY